MSEPRKIDFEKLRNDSIYKAKYNWRLMPRNLAIIEDSLINRNASEDQRIAFFSQVIPEGGGDTVEHKNGSVGIISRRGARKLNYPTTLSGQIHTEMEGLFGPFNKNEWNHGGKGSGYNTSKEAQKAFQTSVNLREATNAVMRGYVRPEPTEYSKRFDFANFLTGFLK